MRTSYWILLAATAFLTGCLSTNALSSAVPRPMATAGIQSSLSGKSSSRLAGPAKPAGHDLLEQHQILLERYAAIARRQEQQTNDLQSAVSEMEMAFEVLATEFESLKPRKSWHRAHVNANNEHYTAVCQFLDQIDEVRFPTVNTWYGEQWQQLTATFKHHYFPTASERDTLVKFIVTIQTDEQRRVTALGDRAAGDPSSGYCLTAPWQETLTHLRAFVY